MVKCDNKGCTEPATMRVEYTSLLPGMEAVKDAKNVCQKGYARILEMESAGQLRVEHAEPVKP